MKRILPFVFLFAIIAGAFGQSYKGVPWTGTAWTFGTDNNANFNVGDTYVGKKGNYNGIPHFLYDIGEVDTLKLAGDDLIGNLVAGSGAPPNTSTADNFREAQATTDAKTLTASDIAAQASDVYGGAFTTHTNRMVLKRCGGWYRYTCSFAEGNYRLLMRLWGNDNAGLPFWIRAYDKATMAPITPWTRYRPGITDPVDMSYAEGLSIVDVSVAPYDAYTIEEINKTKYHATQDEFTLSGEVVIEFSDPGPTADYGVNVGTGGPLGDIVFEYIGPSADKFAPVAEPWKDLYDEGDDFSLTLSEPGTLYLVPNGTAVEDLETANIDKAEMTDNVYTKDPGELLGDTIQLVTMDAAANTRFSAPIVFRNMLIPDTLKGRQYDLIGMDVTRAGIVALLPPGVNPDYTSIIDAVTAGNADTVVFDAPGRDTLKIANLSGDMDCKLYMIDVSANPMVTSDPVAFQLGEGGGGTGVIERLAEVNLFVAGDQLIINNTGDFSDLYIFDLLGKQQMHRSIGSNRVELDASGLSNGIYVAKLNGSKGMVNKKFMINSR